MNFIRSRFSDGVDVRSRLASKLRSVHRLLYLEFLNRFYGWGDDKIVEVLIRDRDSIEPIHIVSAALSGHRERRPRLSQRGAPSAFRLQDDVVAERREVHKHSAVQRQVDQALICD